MNIAVRTQDRFVEVDGRSVRYLEEGSGVPAILLHGSSLGSSADVFRRNLHALARHGIRAIAVDLPGFGKSDAADASSAAPPRKTFLLRFMDALGLERAALIGHSSAGSTVVNLALAHPQRVSHVIILGTGSLLPPLETAAGKVGARGEAAQARLEERMVRQEPSLADTRALLEANLFHHELITPEELELRHQNSIGRCFEQFVLRHAEAQEGGGGKEQGRSAAVAAPDRAQDAAAADLRPRGPRPRGRTCYPPARALPAARSALRGRLQAHGAVGRGRAVSPAGGAVPDAVMRGGLQSC